MSDPTTLNTHCLSVPYSVSLSTPAHMKATSSNRTNDGYFPHSHTIGINTLVICARICVCAFGGVTRLDFVLSGFKIDKVNILVGVECPEATNEKESRPAVP